MTTLLAIDPGSERSAWILTSGGRPQSSVPGWVPFGILPNDELLAQLRITGRSWFGYPAEVVIQQSYGLGTGWETLETARWVGRYQEAADPVPVGLLNRSTILRHLGVVTRGPERTSADAGVTAALIDRFGGTREAAVGPKANPG